MPEDDDDDGGFDAFAARMEAASELRARRDRLFARWHRLQLRLEDWHPLGRLVKLYAGDRLRFRHDTQEVLWHEAFQDLARAIMAGRMPTLFLDRMGWKGAHRLTAGELRDYLDVHPEPVVWRRVLAHCWTPDPTARTWTTEHGLILPARTGSPPTPSPSPPSSPPPPPPPPSRRWAGQNFRSGDRVLAEEIVNGVKDAKGRLLSEWAACLELAPRAEGNSSTLFSKQKRLSLMVKQIKRERQAIQAPENVSQD